MIAALPSTRHELAALFSGEGVELGVAAGKFSEVILRQSACTKLWAIDRWSDHHNDAEHQAACERLTKAGGPRCEVRRMTFAEALLLYQNESLDFVYVDGYAHTGQEGGRTLNEWWPKVKPGGIFAGHDYHPRWKPTMVAVDAFAKKYALEINVTQASDADPFPSWWVVKPHMPEPSKYPIPSSCILVGNGPSVLQAPQGKLIDSFEEVVRFNRYVTEGFERFTGRRTTLWSTYGKVEGQEDFLPGDSTRPERILFRGLVSPKSTRHPAYAPKELFVIDLCHFNLLRRRLQGMTTRRDPRHIIPSSGLLVCHWLLEQGVRHVTLAGFDHFSKKESKQHHYWVPQAFTEPAEHDGQAEAELFSEWMAQGHVSHLPYPLSGT